MNCWNGTTAVGNHDRTFLVHGELKSMQTFAGLLKNSQVIMPDNGCRVYTVKFQACLPNNSGGTIQLIGDIEKETEPSDVMSLLVI